MNIGPRHSKTAGHWFRPLRIRDELLPARTALAPINTGFSAGGEPTAQLLRFHRDRSGPAIGISMVGNVATDERSKTNRRTAVLADGSAVVAFRSLARIIAEAGSIPGIQLASSPESLNPPRVWKSRDPQSEIARLNQLVLALRPDELQETLYSFVRSARLAVEAGFRVVQIHAAHGYLLSLLLTREINLRTDAFAVDSPWLENLIVRVRDEIGNAVLGVRLSAIRGLAAAAQEVEDTRATAKRAVSAGVDVIDYSAGMYTLNKRLIYPGREHAAPVYSDYIEDLGREADHTMVIAGRVTGLGNLNIPYQDRMVVAFGRSLIADPTFCEKWQSGQTASVRQCILTNHCHYFSRGRESLECGVNSEI